MDFKKKLRAALERGKGSGDWESDGKSFQSPEDIGEEITQMIKDGEGEIVFCVIAGQERAGASLMRVGGSNIALHEMIGHLEICRQQLLQMAIDKTARDRD